LWFNVGVVVDVVVYLDGDVVDLGEQDRTSLTLHRTPR